MPSYFCCDWLHDLDDEPIMVYEELNDERLEMRKIHQYRNGRLVRTDRIAPELDTSLSCEPIPSEAAIDAQPEFVVRSLTAAGFQAVWDQAVEAS